MQPQESYDEQVDEDGESLLRPNLEVKPRFKFIFWLFLTVTGFHVGYAMAYTNQTAKTMNAKLELDADQATLYQSLIGSFAVGAMMVGATVGGKLITLGRLRVLYIASVIGMAGVGLTLILNITFILAGRLLYGFATGLIAVAMPRYMDEVLPSSLISLYGGMYCFSFAIATIIAYLLALGLPQDKLPNGDPNTEGLKDSQFWVVIFGLPIVFFLIQDVLACTLCRYESPKFLLFEIDRLQERQERRS